MTCLKLYLSHKPLQGFFFNRSTTLVGLGLIFKASWTHSGVDYTGLHAIRRSVHYQLWNSLAIKTEQVKMNFVQLSSLLTG